MYKADRVTKNVYETTCSRCHRKFQTNRYIHRLEFHELDLDTFHPWSTMAIDLCSKCINNVKEFVFGADEADIFLEEEKMEEQNVYN